MNEPASEPVPSSPVRRRRWRALLWLLALIAVTLAGLWAWRQREALPGWPWFDANGAPAAADQDPLATSIASLEQALAELRREQQQQARRLGEQAATLGVLREELFAVRDRAALLEEALEQANARALRGDQLLRLDEAELLLSLGRQRLELTGDLAGAIHAYALAAQSLAQLSDPAFVNLRQTLDQELAALRALPPDPRARAGGELDAVEAALATLPVREQELASERSGSRLARLLGQLVQVRPVADDLLLRAEDRSAGLTALRLQAALARLALERRDHAGFTHALGQIRHWLRRLYTDSPERQALERRLDELAELPLALELPVLGSTLDQLRQLRAQRPTAAAAPARDPNRNPAESTP